MHFIDSCILPHQGRTLGCSGGQRRRLYRDNLDRLFNPKNDLSLAFFKKLTIAKNFIKPKLLHNIGGTLGIFLGVSMINDWKVYYPGTTFGADPLNTLICIDLKLCVSCKFNSRKLYWQVLKKSHNLFIFSLDSTQCLNSNGSILGDSLDPASNSQVRWPFVHWQFQENCDGIVSQRPWIGGELHGQIFP